MPPINANLDRITLPTDAESSLVKVLILHDSQGLRQSNRWVGQTQKWPVEHTGMFIHAVSNTSVGLYHEVDPFVQGYTYTTALLDPDDAWPDGNDTDHVQHSRLVSLTSNPTPNFRTICAYGWVPGGFAVALDMAARKFSKTLVRSGANTFVDIRLQEYRDSGGQTTDFTGLPLDGSVVSLEREIREFASAETAVGIRVQDGVLNDDGLDLEVLGSLIYNSASGSDLPADGLVLVNAGWSGWSATEHLNGQSEQVRESLAEIVGGYDLIILMFGHNAELTGDIPTNFNALINAWKAAHTAVGASEPDFLIIAPWESTGTHSMNATRAAQMYQVAIAGGHGFISLWDSYSEVTPAGRTERLDGVAADYTLDPLHPDDAETAEAVAMDIWWHFQPANWLTVDTPTTIPGHRIGRRRSRRGNRRSRGAKRL